MIHLATSIMDLIMSAGNLFSLDGNERNIIENKKREITEILNAEDVPLEVKKIIALCEINLQGKIILPDPSIVSRNDLFRAAFAIGILEPVQDLLILQIQEKSIEMRKSSRNKILIRQKKMLSGNC